jgi:hypothetical protein
LDRCGRYLKIYSKADIFGARRLARRNHGKGTKSSLHRADYCKIPPPALAKHRLWQPVLHQKIQEETNMQTLHDMLKREPVADRRKSQPDYLHGRYSKIGISAVAAATQFNRVKDAPAPRTAADRSSARGWSRHR